MSQSLVLLTVDQVLAIHHRMILEFGGAEGVRDRGLLESAIAMPAAGFAGKFLHKGIPAMAGAYLFHLCMNHPFVDGNKRSALASSLIFLLANGRDVLASDDELERLTLGVANGSLSKVQVSKFFRRSVRRVHGD